MNNDKFTKIKIENQRKRILKPKWKKKSANKNKNEKILKMERKIQVLKDTNVSIKWSKGK